MNDASSRFRRTIGRAIALAAVVIAVAPGAAIGADDNEDKAARAAARALKQSWPDHPEWVDMLADIMQGSQLGPNEGWFRTAVAQKRLNWGFALKRWDRNGDGRIARREFSGPASDFARLDRDRDQVITEADFDFSPTALAATPGSVLFYMMDSDGNGKVTRKELDEFFKSNDSGDQDFLSLNDFQDAFRPSPRPASGSGAASREQNSGPSRDILIRGLFRQEIGSLQPGPALNESVPDFTLKTNDGGQTITLSKLIGPKPVVLVFGNFTCGPFRAQAGNVEKVYQLYKDRATFVMVYVREAHPTDGWRMESNDRVEVTLPQPRTYEERVAVAKTCSARLNLGFPMLVDSIDDEVGARYSGMPSRLYLIDRQGKVAYKSGRGPFGFKPAELEQSLILLLQDQTADAEPTGGSGAGAATKSEGKEKESAAKP